MKGRKLKEENIERFCNWMKEEKRDPDRELVRDYEKYLKNKNLKSKTIETYLKYLFGYIKIQWGIVVLKPTFSKGISFRKMNRFTTDQINKIKKHVSNDYQFAIFVDWINIMSIKKLADKYAVSMPSIIGVINGWIKKAGLYPDYKPGDIKHGILLSEKDKKLMTDKMIITGKEKRKGYGFNKKNI